MFASSVTVANKLVSIHIQAVVNLSAAALIGTVPNVCKPPATVFGVAINAANGQCIPVIVNASGELRVPSSYTAAGWSAYAFITMQYYSA